MSGVTQRSYNISHIVTLVESAELLRRKTHHLHYKCDGAFVNVGASNGEWHALALLVDTHDDEVASLAAHGNQWSFDFEQEHPF